MFLLICAGGAAWSVRKFYESLNSSLTKMNEKPIATITFKHKTAQRKFTERVIWDRLRQHSPVYDGDTIRTAPGSEATIYFNDGNVMDLDENTMAQVFFHDGQVEASVSGGKFSFDSSGASNGALVKTGGSSVIISAGSAFSASFSEEDGVKVRVVGGEVVFEDEGGLARSIEAGHSIALDSNGDEQIIPLIAVSSPSANAKVLAFSGKEENVQFSWAAQNIAEGDYLLLQISRDKKFDSIERTLDLQGLNQIRVGFEAGIYYWRIFPKNAGPEYSAQSKIKVISAPPPSLIAPESRSNYSYKARLPEVRFSWTGNDIVTAYDLQVADNPRMENPVVEQRCTTPSSIVSTLGEGTWYWRVAPFYTINGIGLGEASEIRAFTIVRRQKIEPPELILPASNAELNTAIKDSIQFSWKNNPEAVGYEIKISADPKCYDAKTIQKTASNFWTIQASEIGMQAGTWYWCVTQYDSDGDISDQSEIRKFETRQVKYEQRAVYPPDNFAVTDENLPELRFTWKTNIPGDNKFQISRDKDFSSLALDQVDNDKFFQGANLKAGTYYWRISSAVSPDQYSTEGRSFKVVSNLSAPSLLYPKTQETLSILGPSQTRFRWRAVPDADLYMFSVYERAKPGELLVSETIPDIYYDVDLSKFEDGSYAWTVQALSEESKFSSRRFSPTSDGDFRLVQVRKIKLDYPLDGAVIDGISAALNPQSVRWSCERDVKDALWTLSKNPNGYSNALASAVNPGREVKLPSLEPGLYYWTVRGKNSGGANVSPDRANSFRVSRIAALASPRITSPEPNKIFGAAEIRSSRKIQFAWQPVPSATSYSFAIRNERGQILVGKTLKEPRFVLDDMAYLQNGRFTYSVYASQNLPDGSLLRRGDAASGVFAINLPAAGDIVIDDTGVLYGM